MRIHRSLGLLGAGPVSKSFVVRIPGLGEHLGPVMARPLRVASRIVNVMHAGYPVQGCDDFEFCPVVLVSVPDNVVGGYVAELSAAPFLWNGKIVLLCGSNLDSRELEPLARRGACTASVNPVGGFEERWFVTEGHPVARRKVKQMLQHGDTSVFELDDARKQNYLAALTFASSFFTSLLDASAQSLRDAGLKPRVAMEILERLFHHGFRAYLHAGRKSGSGPLARERLDLIQFQLEALTKTNPRLAEYFVQGALLAVKMLNPATESLTATVQR